MSKLRRGWKSFWAPPEFADRRQLEAGQTLHTILFGGLFVALGFTVSAPFLFENPWPSLFGYFAMMASHAVAILLVKRGRVRPVAIAMTLFMFVFVTIKAARFGGLRGIGIFVYPTVVILAALTWSVRAAVGVAVAASLAAAGMELYDPLGWNETFARPTPVRAWVSLTGVMAIVTVMVSVALRSIRNAQEREQRLRDQLRQTQKHEALGRLAAGVAHDFNNMLMVITGNLALIKADRAAADAVDQIQQATEHAGELTKQLLEFGKRQRSTRTEVSIGDATAGCLKLVRTLLPERITVLSKARNDAALIRIDPASFERIVVNLATNARDAMPNGGVLQIEVARCHVELRDRDHARGVPTGDYARLVVEDDGSGMSAETQAMVFEPFYTTKSEGRGTGLGLTSIQGIVTQVGGHILLTSAPNQGTRFEIFLPLLQGSFDSDPPRADSSTTNQPSA